MCPAQVLLFSMSVRGQTRLVCFLYCGTLKRISSCHLDVKVLLPNALAADGILKFYADFSVGLILHECFTVPEFVQIHFLQSSNSSILAHECLPCSIKLFSSFQDCVFLACEEVVGRDSRFVNSVISWSLIEPWLADLGPCGISMVALPVCWNHGEESDGIVSDTTRNIQTR